MFIKEWMYLLNPTAKISQRYISPVRCEWHSILRMVNRGASDPAAILILFFYNLRVYILFLWWGFSCGCYMFKLLLFTLRHIFFYLLNIKVRNKWLLFLKSRLFFWLELKTLQGLYVRSPWRQSQMYLLCLRRKKYFVNVTLNVHYKSRKRKIIVFF